MFVPFITDDMATPQNDLLVLRFLWEHRYNEGIVENTICHYLGLNEYEVAATLHRLQQKKFVERFFIFTGGTAWKCSCNTEESFQKLKEKYNGILNEG